VKVDKTLDEVSATDYDAVVLPGGQINPDLLRVEPKALKFIKDIFDAKKVVAAVCHAPWLETGIAKGRKMTSYKSIKTDVANAGAKSSPHAIRATWRLSAPRSSKRSRKAAIPSAARPDGDEDR
jgi:putative intracellular protease/amidase